MNGLIYLMTGVLFIAWPGAIQTLFRDADFVGYEGALIRVIGVTVTGEAEALLIPAVFTGDPEVSWRLADVMVVMGKFAEAKEQMNAARSRFEFLLENICWRLRTMERSSTPAVAAMHKELSNLPT